MEALFKRFKKLTTKNMFYAGLVVFTIVLASFTGFFLINSSPTIITIDQLTPEIKSITGPIQNIILMEVLF